jgi:hypothetical protein
VITAADIAHWRTRVPWVDPDQVEQDLLLSRLIVEIANDAVLGPELVFRGGTCLHKLWLDQPWRYSEDLDYVRRSAGGIGDLLDALRALAERVGFERVSTAIGAHPKARFRSTFATGGPMSVKVEINTFERSPARAIITRHYRVDSPWFRGEAGVPTFEIAELVATKIRALFQRKKGRDLFDLWLAVEHAGVDPADIATCFAPYRPDGWTVDRALENVDEKLDDSRFTTDLDPLLSQRPDGYTTEAAAGVARAVILATS